MYIQFEAPSDNKSKRKDGPIKRSVKKGLLYLLTTVTSKANPDYDHKIEYVKRWLVEFDNETVLPEREIGLDKGGRVIMKMPFQSNYGY